MAKTRKRDPVSSIAALRVGSLDSSGNRVEDILAKGNEYAIYEIQVDDPEKKLRVLIDGYTDASEKRITDRYDAVKPLYVLAKGLLYRASNFSLMKSRIGHTLASALYKETPDIAAQFQRLIDEINQEYRHLFWSRVCFLAPGFVSLTVLSALLLGNYLGSFASWPISLWDQLLVGLSGLMGGVFSQTFNLRTRRFEAEIGKGAYVLLGAERIVLAAIAAVVSLFAIKANVVLGTLNTKGDIHAFLFVGVAAGFSETFLPSLLDRFQRQP